MSFTLINYLEEIKQKITDQQYKQIMEESMSIYHDSQFMISRILRLKYLNRSLTDKTAEAYRIVELVKVIRNMQHKKCKKLMRLVKKLEYKLNSVNYKLEHSDRTLRTTRGKRPIK